MALLLPDRGLGQARIAVALDSTQLLIGDQVRMQIDLALPAGADPQIQINYDTLEAEGKVELIALEPPRTITREPEIIMEQELQLTSFDTGYHYLPPLRFVYRRDGQSDTVYSNDLALRVATLPVTEDSELRDIKPIKEEPLKLRDFFPYLIGAGLALLLVLLALAWRRRRRPREEAPPPPPVPAHEKALQLLAELEQSRLWQRGEVKAFQSQLTYILRDYLENRFAVPALESTTLEIDRALARFPELAEWRTRLRELLQTADMVKFAKAVPDVSAHEQGLVAVRTFVETTQAPEPAPDEETEAEEVNTADE
jgi:hypothetical protein